MDIGEQLMEFLFSEIARDLVRAQVNEWPYARYLTRQLARLRARWSQR